MIQKRFFLWLLLPMVALGQALAQPVSIFIRFSNGSLSAYPLSQVKKISFENDFVRLQLQDGTQYSWAAATIDHYKYDITTSVKDVVSGPNAWEVKVIPNPSDGRQTVKLRLPSGGDVRIQVFDAAGKQVLEKQYPNRSAGEQELGLDWPQAIPGNYRLLLKTSDFAVSQTIIRR